MWDKKAVTDAMVAKLEESGVTPAHAKKLGFRPLTAEELQKELPGLPEYRGGFVIPYRDFYGKPTKACRVRYLEPATGFDALTNKVNKYGQQKGTKPAIYWPVSKEWGWPGVAQDPEVTVWVTEGELKSVCAALFGLPTIGLGGVSMYGPGKGSDALVNKDLERLNWVGRRVNIAYDSDAKTNSNVRRAQNALALQLTAFKAKPFIVDLAKLAAPGKKLALDDCLTKLGEEAFLDLCAQAEPYAASAALHKMAEEAVYVHEPSTVYLTERDILVKVTPFVNEHYATRTHKEEYETPAGNKATRIVKTAKAYIDWPGRVELQGLTFKPGQPLIVGERLNKWRGWPVEPVKGDVSWWVRLLDRLFTGKEPGTRRWFEQWVAYPMQHPGAKLKQAVLMWGGQGIGKSFLGEIIGRLYGPYFIKFDSENLISSFNDWADSRQFGMGEEIVINTMERGATSEKIKTLITSPTILINSKGIKPYEMPNVMNVMVASNHATSLKLEYDDRRWFVNRIISPKLEDTFYGPLDVWSRSPEGLSALFYHLLNLNLNGYEPNAAAMVTYDKREMIGGGASPLEDWVARIKYDPDSALRISPESAPCRYRLFTADDLFAMFKASKGNELTRATPNVMGNVLAMAGFVKPYAGVIRTSRGARNLWAVKPNSEDLFKMTPAELGRYYDKEREMPKPKFTKGARK